MDSPKTQSGTVITIALLLVLAAAGGGAYIQRARSNNPGSSQGSVSPTVAVSPSTNPNQTGNGTGGVPGSSQDGGLPAGRISPGYYSTQQQGTINRFISPTSRPTPTPAPVATFVDCGYGEGGTACTPSNPRTCAIWNESKILAAYQKPGADGILHMWYDDEHSLTLGSGTITPLTKSPDHAVNPNTGNQDAIDGAERPIRPALFITDITTNPNDRSGDWENKGKAYNPSEIFGTWKALGDKNDGQANGTDLGPGSVPMPVSALNDYTAEVRWNLLDPSFALQKGHTYRLEFMVHDGDVHDNGASADSGEKCSTITL